MKLLTRFVLALVAAVAVVAVLIINPLSSLAPDTVEAGPAARATATVDVVTLTGSGEAGGMFGARAVRTVASSTLGTGGTITWVAEVGTELSTGDRLIEIDESPVVYLPGSVPVWRTMGVDDVGDDVAQLEAGLVELGYDTAGELSVDGTYTSYTADLVELWQADMGWAETGSVALGTVMFFDEGAAVASVGAAVGDTVGAGAASGVVGAETIVLVSGGLEATFEVPVGELVRLPIGGEVVVELPDRQTVTAEVTGRVPLGGGTWLVTAEPVQADMDAGTLSDLPVTVEWSYVEQDETMVVPAEALQRLDSGQYVVEKVVDNGTEFVPVEPGTSANRLVAVTGDLRPGELIIAP